MAGWIAPPEGPLSPQNSSGLSTPRNHQTNRPGVPPSSHAHLNERVPTRNEELPGPQLYPDDFSNVLRKKHATGRHLLAGMRVAPRANYLVKINGLLGPRPGRSRATTFLRQPGSSSPIGGVRFFGEIPASWLASAQFARPTDNDWRHAFGDVRSLHSLSRLFGR
jgi:hypothetical protein